MFAGEVRHDPDIGKFLFAAFAIMGVMGPRMIAFGPPWRSSETTGCSHSSACCLRRAAVTLLAKMQMALLFAVVVMASLLVVPCRSATCASPRPSASVPRAPAFLGSLPF